MGKFIAHYHFSVNDLTILGELLGSKYDFKLNDHDCYLEIPKDNSSFGLSDDPEEEITAITGSRGTQENPKKYVKISIIRIGYEFETDFDVPVGTTDGDVLNKLNPYLQQGAETATLAAKNYVNIARVEAQQAWLGTQIDEPELIWISDVYDDRNNRLRTGYMPPINLRFISENEAITPDKQSEIVNKLEAGDLPTLAKSFLYDALFLTNQNGDPAQAVLYAAIACEVQIKVALIALASDEQLGLVSALLENPRDFSLAAASLYDKGLKAVTGRSLREENRDLYKKVSKLFEDRNAVAHRGQGPSNSVATADVNAAKEAIEWLLSAFKESD
jgi:hypothetical protein